MASPSPGPQVSTPPPDLGLASSSAHRVRFGLFEADLRARELRKRGAKVRLPDQPFQILQLLLERPGDVVTRDELRERLWSADTFVDFDLSLNSAVRKLREALGDSAEHSTFIETLPRRGYRFIASVERPPAADAVAPATESQLPRRRSRARLLWGVTALVVLLIGALMVRNGWTGLGDPAVPLTSSVSPEANDLYNKALLAANGTYEGSRAAASYLEQAIAMQPDFGMAHARLAQAWEQFLTSGPMSPAEVLPKAESAARKALDLDDTLSYAHMALATVRHAYGDHAGAMTEADRAMELAPFNAQTLVLHARLLMCAGRTEEATVAAERARKLDPLSVNALVLVARTLSADGQHTRAIEELNKALKMAPNRADLPFHLGATYVLKGDIKAAIPEFEKAVALSTQRNPRFRAYLGYAYAMDGRTRESQQLLQELLALRERQYVSSFGIALIHDALADKAATLTALERAFQEHALEFRMLYLYPSFKTLASEPRYQELIQHFGASR